MWRSVELVTLLPLLLLLLTLALVGSTASSDAEESIHDGDAALVRLRRATCSAGDCKNGGVCNPTKIGGKCVCPLPYASDCTVLIDFCATPQPDKGIDPAVAPVCLNGGACLGTALTEPYFNCSCVPGFNGSRCETNIDDCVSHPCTNGQCTDLVNSFSCSCYSGWEGKNCSVNHDDCVAGACLNGGRCLDGNSTYTCNCSDTGFSGSRCETNIDDCSPNPCVNGASCLDGVKNYSCNCLSGYSGRNCTVDFPDCSPTPCQYNGTCLERSRQTLYGNASLPAPFSAAFNYSLAAGFVCICPPGVFGPTCSVNPNDCLLPVTNLTVCVHASDCTDGLNSFTCHCLPGYDGQNCSHDIDECQLFGQPCQNGATCQDLKADYVCKNCPAGFGGKNCSIALIGCQPNKCENATSESCQPILVSELPTPVHDYRCTCKAGWSGHNCSSSTLVSFNGSNSFVVLLGNSSVISDWILEFTFRTSLTQFDLIGISSDWGIIRVGAHNSSLILQLLNASSLSSAVIGQARWPIAASLVSADWLRLSIVLTNGSATLSPIGSESSQSEMLIGGLAEKFRRGQMTVRVGGDAGVVSAIDSGGFRGCVRDLRLLAGDSTSVAMETTIASGNATWGVCNRTAQCTKPSPCQMSSSLSCSDLWNDFACRCQPDFGGRICSVQLPSFTFGLDGNVSSATFASLPAVTDVYGSDDTWTIELKLLTLSPGAFLLLLGDPSDSAASPRLLATILSTGRLSAQLLHSNGSQIARLESTDSVAMGIFVSVRISVSISARMMSLTASSTVTSASFSNISSLSQLSGHLIIGGFIGASAAPAPPALSIIGDVRAKRSVPSLPGSVASSMPGNVTAFRGILSSATVNTRPLIIGSLNASLIDSLPGALAASDFAGLVPGRVTETVCRHFAPCKNGATCTDVFYNYYSCKCAIGWLGANCTQRNHCYAGAEFCPNGTQCVNVDSNGYECRTSATFGSSNQSSPATHLDLSVNGISESLATVAGWVRTRQSDCQLVSVTSGGRQLSIRCSSSSHMQASLDNQTVLVSVVAIATGVPFNFSVVCSPGSPLTLHVSVNDSDVITSASSSSAIATGLMLNSVAMVTLGDAKFKGCLDNVRLNGHLAPLVNRSLDTGASGLAWSLSANQSSSAKPLIGCHGDPVCQAVIGGSSGGSVCRNSGKCSDLWNAFVCDCHEGYFGATCRESVTNMTTPVIVGAVIATIVVIAVIIATVVLVKWMQAKRKDTGEYEPTEAEITDKDWMRPMPGWLPPPEELLI